MRIVAHRKKKRWSVTRRGRTTIARARTFRWTYDRRDIGRRGRGKKVIPPLRAGLMTRTAREIGIIDPDQKLLEGVSKSEIPMLARALVRKYGYASARGKAMSRYVLAGGKKAKDRARAGQRRFFKTLHTEIVRQGQRS